MKIYVVVLFEDELDSVYDNIDAARARVDAIEGIYGHAWFIESEVRSTPKESVTTDYLDYQRETLGDPYFRESVSRLQLRGLAAG